MPAYNEVNTIEKNLKNYCKYFEEKQEQYEIIVSCDGCIDDTVKIVKTFAKSNPNVKCLEFLEKTGKGRAITEGFKVSKGDIVGFVDADDAYSYKDIIKLIDYIKSNKCDVIIASKWKDISFKAAEGPLTRKIIGRLWNILIRILFTIDFKDTQGGAKIIKKDVLKNVIDILQCNGFEFDVELLWRLSQKNYLIKEVFIISKSSKKTSVTVKDYFSMLFNILKLRIGVINEK
jgi:glycosyltransferase involved in cell wall biosynthesis